MADLGFVGVYIFSSMVILADEKDCVRMDDRSLWRRLHLDAATPPCKVRVPFAAFQAVLRKLQEPDPNSNIRVHEGRRIIPISEIEEIPGNRGYWVVNRHYYKKLASRSSKLEADRLRIAEKRVHGKVNKNDSVADSRDQSRKVANVAQARGNRQEVEDNNTPPCIPPKGEIPKKSKRGSQVPANFPVTADMRAYAQRLGVAAVDAETEQFLDHHRARGTVFRDWQAAWRTWMRNSVKFSKGRSGSAPAPDDWTKVQETVKGAL